MSERQFQLEILWALNAVGQPRDLPPLLRACAETMIEEGRFSRGERGSWQLRSEIGNIARASR